MFLHIASFQVLNTTQHGSHIWSRPDDVPTFRIWHQRECIIWLFPLSQLHWPVSSLSTRTTTTSWLHHWAIAATRLAVPVQTSLYILPTYHHDPVRIPGRSSRASHCKIQQQQNCLSFRIWTHSPWNCLWILPCHLCWCFLEACLELWLSQLRLTVTYVLGYHSMYIN